MWAGLAEAEALAASDLRHEQLEQLADRVRDAGPLELPILIGAFEGKSDEALGLRLVEALGRSPGAANLQAPRLAQIVAGYPAAVRSAADAISRSATADLAARRAKLSESAAQLAAGDIQRGRSLFHSQTVGCAACHRVGDEGGNVGPNLSQIGRIRSRLDLLESILFPSASQARGYESYTVVTTMPQGLERLMSPAELADLVAYLESLK